MTRRLVAAALLAGSLGVVASTAVAYASPGNEVCLGGDSAHSPGRSVYYCLQIRDGKIGH
jgi:hypothetical protein